MNGVRQMVGMSAMPIQKTPHQKSKMPRMARLPQEMMIMMTPAKTLQRRDFHMMFFFSAMSARLYLAPTIIAGMRPVKPTPMPSPMREWIGMKVPARRPHTTVPM